MNKHIAKSHGIVITLKAIFLKKFEKTLET